MADSISIVMKMNDEITGKLKSIASTSKGTEKSALLEGRAGRIRKK